MQKEQTGIAYTLFMIGVRYHYETEHFDRLICDSFRRTGRAIPVTTEETRLCSQNARHWLQRLTDDAAHDGYTREDVKRAIQETAGRYSYEKMERILLTGKYE